MTRQPTHEDWQRVGAAVRARRNKLGLAQGERKPSAATWRKVENALDYPYAERTVSAMCRALDWPVDAFDRLLAGDDIDALLDATNTGEETDESVLAQLLRGQRQITDDLRQVHGALARLADLLEAQRSGPPSRGSDR